MEKLKVLVEKLRKKYQESRMKQMKRRYGDGAGSPEFPKPSKRPELPKPSKPPQSPDVTEKHGKVMFRNDVGYNKKKLQEILDDYSYMCRELKNAYPMTKENETYYKCVSQFEAKLRQLSEKDATLRYGEKTAKRMESFLKQTLIKVWDLGNGSHIFERHMETWGIGMKSYSRGYQMSDDDLDYLDLDTLRAYKVDTADRTKNYQVIEMIHPVFSIGYQPDGEEPESVYIMGKCRFYCFSNHN